MEYRSHALSLVHARKRTRRGDFRTPSPSMPTPATGGPPGGGKAPCNCNDPVSDLPAFVPDESSDAPIRYNDGVINYRMVDLSSSGFGSTWTQSRSWTNDSTYSGDSI